MPKAATKRLSDFKDLAGLSLEDKALAFVSEIDSAGLRVVIAVVGEEMAEAAEVYGNVVEANIPDIFSQLASLTRKHNVMKKRNFSGEKN